MFTTRAVLCSVCLGAFLASACGSDSPTTPSASSLSGTWTGSANAAGSAAGNGVVRATLAQSGSSLSGTWGTSYSNTIYNNSGSLSGTVSGAAISLTLTPSVPTSCPLNVTATLAGSSAMSGTFAVFNCTVAQSGSFAMTK